jgi:hypothetical protein
VTAVRLLLQAQLWLSHRDIAPNVIKLNVVFSNLIRALPNLIGYPQYHSTVNHKIILTRRNKIRCCEKFQLVKISVDIDWGCLKTKFWADNLDLKKNIINGENYIMSCRPIILTFRLSVFIINKCWLVVWLVGWWLIAVKGFWGLCDIFLWKCVFISVTIAIFMVMLLRDFGPCFLFMLV